MKITKPLKLLIIVIFFIGSLIIYYLLVRKSAIKLYCKLQIENKINNFRRSVKRNGQIIAIEDENHLSSLKNPLIKQCIRAESSQIL